jgi:hypothetical protein
MTVKVLSFKKKQHIFVQTANLSHFESRNIKYAESIFYKCTLHSLHTKYVSYSVVTLPLNVQLGEPKKTMYCSTQAVDLICQYNQPILNKILTFSSRLILQKSLFPGMFSTNILFVTSNRMPNQTASV